jgi:hypothetical protein
MYEESSYIKDKKKKKGARQSKKTPNTPSDDDTVSETSSTISELQEDGNQSWEDSFREAIDNLSDKRAFVRMESLQIIRKTMAHHFTLDILHNYTETLIKDVLSCIIKGSPEESSLAAKVLGLIALTVGEHHLGLVSDELYHKIVSTLETRLLDGKATTTTQEQLTEVSERRADIVFTLGLWHFVRDTVQELLRPKDGVLDRIRIEYFSEKDSRVVAAAARAWTLMATQASYHERVELLLPSTRPILIKLLGSTSVDVRIAAGEALALLYEGYHQVHEEQEPEDEDVLNELIDLIGQLVSEGSKSTGKKDKSKQKGTFREYLRTIEEGESPHEQITVRKTQVEFNDWAHIIQFNAFKEMFGHGIVRHFQENPLVRNVLNIVEHSFDENSVQKLTAAEKKFYLSKSSEFSRRDTIDKATRTRQFSSFYHNHE